MSGEERESDVIVDFVFEEGVLYATVANIGETNAAREILDIAIRRRRIQRQEHANVLRTMATLSMTCAWRGSNSPKRTPGTRVRMAPNGPR